MASAARTLAATATCLQPQLRQDPTATQSRKDGSRIKEDPAGESRANDTSNNSNNNNTRALDCLSRMDSSGPETAMRIAEKGLMASWARRALDLVGSYLLGRGRASPA